MLDGDRTVVQLDFGDHLNRLSASLGVAMLEDRGRVRIVCRTVPLLLDMDRAVPLALIASELMTSSLKYAYSHPAAGEIHVELVRDHGRGFESDPAPGFGLGIIRLLTSQLEATLTLAGDDGVTARVEFAVPADLAA